MNKLEVMWNLGNIELTIEVIKWCFIILFAYYIFVKISNIKNIKIGVIMFILFSIPAISITITKIKYKFDLYCSLAALICIVTAINGINFRKNIIYSIILTIISISISYVIYMIAVSLAFFPNAIFAIQNDYISLTIIVVIYTLLIYKLFKIKKLKYGMEFLQRKLEDSYFSILILNTGAVILFLNIIIQSYGSLISRGVWVTFMTLSIVMFITIKQSFNLYYKQNLLIKELEETRAELDSKNKTIEKLEKENLEFGKTSHSLAHKQKVLEYKLNQLLEAKGEVTSEEKHIKEELEDISETIYNEPKEIELTKTDISVVDDMLKYMQSECTRNNIKFELQIIGNIHYMVNHLITEDELQILIADHIKDAIIAINSSDNVNKSILVRLGNIDGVYSLCIYDSGVEFAKEVLDKLGKEPITTHKDDGGTGMGFMNTFDLLNKYNASLVINEMGEPSKDNYTKAVIFKFDNQGEFRVESYRETLEHSN